MKAKYGLLAVVLMVFGCAQWSPERATNPTLRRATVNGAELTYVEQGAGETVVFVHGSATDYRVWEEVRRRLGDQFRFVAYSRRHHAPNAWPDDGGSYTMTQHADDLVGLIDALGVKRAHVVAVSMGARVAAHAAVHHPKVVQTLTLSDGFLATPVTDEGKRVMAKLEPQFATMFSHIRAGDHAAAVAAYVDLASPAAGWKGLGASWQAYYLDNARTLSLAARDSTLRPPTCEALGTIRVPVLVIAGDRTPPALRVTNEALMHCLPPGAQFAEVPRAGHYWYADNPRDGAQLLLAFLRGDRVTSAPRSR